MERSSSWFRAVGGLPSRFCCFTGNVRAASRPTLWPRGTYDRRHQHGPRPRRGYRRAGVGCDGHARGALRAAIRVAILVGLALGGVFAIALIAYRRGGRRPASGRRPGAKAILSIDDPVVLRPFDRDSSSLRSHDVLAAPAHM